MRIKIENVGADQVRVTHLDAPKAGMGSGRKGVPEREFGDPVYVLPSGVIFDMATGEAKKETGHEED